MGGPNLWILRIGDVSMMVPERRAATVFERKGTEIVGRDPRLGGLPAKGYRQ